MFFCMPLEMQHGILRHAGHLARLRFDRLPQPQSPDAVSRLWIEVFMANDLAAARELPRMALTFETIFIHTSEMCELARACRLLVGSPPLFEPTTSVYSDNQMADGFETVLVRMPDVALAAIPFFVAALGGRKHWRTIFLPRFAGMRDVVAGTFVLDSVGETGQRSRERLAMLQGAFLVATYLGRHSIVETILRANVICLSITGAVAARNEAVVQLYFDAHEEFPLACSVASIEAALLNGDEELAVRMVCKWGQLVGHMDDMMLLTLLRVGSIGAITRVFEDPTLEEQMIRMIGFAANCGRLDVLEMLQDKTDVYELPLYVVRAGVSSGHIHVVAWMIEHSLGSFHPILMLDAALSGSVAVMQLLHDRAGCEARVDAIAEVAKAGHLGTVEWLLARAAAIWDLNELGGATGGRQRTELARLAPPVRRAWIDLAINGAVVGGHVELVDWLCEHYDVALPTGVVDIAFDDENIEMVDYLLKAGGKSKASLVQLASKCGSLELVKVIMPHIPRRFWRCALDAAKKNGSADIAQWIEQEMVRLKQMDDDTSCSRTESKPANDARGSKRKRATGRARVTE
ncbi:hypothetical protein HK105_208540 [Polyrhizophydium stewartii]|uniref:Ankyrin repeat protein n=1 Tax=Polyrhizophydium stewartii TaxID=2732419 RepID=A0ABR4MXK8_9FUNG